MQPIRNLCQIDLEEFNDTHKLKLSDKDIQTLLELTALSISATKTEREKEDESIKTIIYELIFHKLFSNNSKTTKEDSEDSEDSEFNNEPDITDHIIFYAKSIFKIIQEARIAVGKGVNFAHTENVVEPLPHGIDDLPAGFDYIPETWTEPPDEYYNNPLPPGLRDKYPNLIK